MTLSRSILTAVGGILFLCVRGVLLWLFLIPSVVVWLVGLVVWPFLRPLGVRVPLSLLFYSRWATYLLEGILTRITPLPATQWPWQADVRNSKISSWNDAFDLPLS
ncbi:MAG: hypothetical protein JWR52_1773 [Marmoricola sp.]|nr:hypothetical protein [Marmoricola sp.]